MEQDHGWIALHRKIRYSWIWDDPLLLKAWLDILISVNHQERSVRIGNRIVSCKRGESLRSLQTWGQRWGWNKSRVRRFFKLLKSDNMIETFELQGTTHLKVCNYEDYQTSRNANETQMKRKRIVNGSQTAPKKNGNKGNNETIKQKLIESLSKIFEESFWPEYPNKASKKKALESWCNRLISLKVKEDFIKDTIIPALLVQKNSEQWLKERGRYIPHASTWINQEKWNDEEYVSEDVWENL